MLDDKEKFLDQSLEMSEKEIKNMEKVLKYVLEFNRQDPTSFN